MNKLENEQSYYIYSGDQIHSNISSIQVFIEDSGGELAKEESGKYESPELLLLKGIDLEDFISRLLMNLNKSPPLMNKIIIYDRCIKYPGFLVPNTKLKKYKIMKTGGKGGKGVEGGLYKLTISIPDYTFRLLNDLKYQSTTDIQKRLVYWKTKPKITIENNKVYSNGVEWYTVGETTRIQCTLPKYPETEYSELIKNKLEESFVEINWYLQYFVYCQVYTFSQNQYHVQFKDDKYFVSHYHKKIIHKPHPFSQQVSAIIREMGNTDYQLKFIRDYRTSTHNFPCSSTGENEKRWWSSCDIIQEGNNLIFRDYIIVYSTRSGDSSEEELTGWAVSKTSHYLYNWNFPIKSTAIDEIILTTINKGTPFIISRKEITCSDNSCLKVLVDESKRLFS